MLTGSVQWAIQKIHSQFSDTLFLSLCGIEQLNPTSSQQHPNPATFVVAFFRFVAPLIDCLLLDSVFSKAADSQPPSIYVRRHLFYHLNSLVLPQQCAFSHLHPHDRFSISVTEGWWFLPPVVSHCHPWAISLSWTPSLCANALNFNPIHPLSIQYCGFLMKPFKYAHTFMFLLLAQNKLGQFLLWHGR